MFGLKIRSWMETHLVRSKKKRNKDGTKTKLEKLPLPSDHISVVDNDFEYQSAQSMHDVKKTSPTSTIKTTTTENSSLLKSKPSFTCTVNLSSPESAYSTGYSTDGTSPGASLPPEYYLKIRSGMSHIRSNNDTTKIDKLTPRSARRKKEELRKRKFNENSIKNLPESSTEDEILNTDVSTKERSSTHRRTESYDEKNQSSKSIAPQSVPPSSIPSSPIPYHCSSPYLPGSSPRPRNRIRTNPWLPSNPNAPTNQESCVDVSAVESNSTRSSTSFKENSTIIKKIHSPKNLSPFVKKRNLCKESVITTCSPLSSRSCHHSKSQSQCEDSLSSTLSSSDDECHGNTSDFSEDDITLNEMLGKYDESYTYEKETDILSDSDDDQRNEDNNRSLDMICRDFRDNFDFIDTSSLANSENNSPMPDKRLNTGHCYYQLSERWRRQRSSDSRSSSRDSSILKRSKKENEKPSKSRNLPRTINSNAKCERPVSINRILNDQITARDTRSANTTPVGTRKRLLDNGRKLKNSYITNLINSNISLADKTQNGSDQKINQGSVNSGSTSRLENKRSNSLSQELPVSFDDIVYKKLTAEANNIIEKLEHTKLLTRRKAVSAHSSPMRTRQSVSPSRYNSTYSPNMDRRDLVCSRNTNNFRRPSNSQHINENRGFVLEKRPHPISQSSPRSSNLDLNLYRNLSPVKSTAAPIPKSTALLSRYHFPVESNSSFQTIKKRSDGSVGNYHEPVYSNIMETMSPRRHPMRPTPVKTPVPYLHQQSLETHNILINPKVYRGTMAKCATPPSYRQPMTTFQRVLGNHQVRSNSDIRYENRPKSLLPQNQFTDLFNETGRAYCPGSEPLRRKMYTTSEGFGSHWKPPVGPSGYFQHFM